jgi:hypothetical protein
VQIQRQSSGTFGVHSSIVSAGLYSCVLKEQKSQLMTKANNYNGITCGSAVEKVISSFQAIFKMQVPAETSNTVTKSPCGVQCHPASALRAHELHKIVEPRRMQLDR